MSTDTVDTNSIPEVGQFLEVQEQLEAFKDVHADVFEKFEDLAEDYNQKLEAADKAVRAKQVSCGPFDLYQRSVKYDPKVLFESVGRERFINVGGTMETRTVYDVDKVRIEASIESGLIPSDLVPQFRKVSPRYHKPGKVDLP